MTTRPTRKRRTARKPDLRSETPSVVVIPPEGTPEELIALLRSWREGGDGRDLEEERKTGEELMRALEKRREDAAKRFA
jgi:hypothetical protein